MLNHLICGSGNFLHEEEDEFLGHPCASSPKKTRNNKTKNNNNPYSTRGLDKFAAVLADLEEKRKKIYDQMNRQDISLLRFGYSNSKDWVPIVVKLRKDNKQFKPNLNTGSKCEPAMQNSEPNEKSSVKTSSVPSEHIELPKTGSTDKAAKIGSVSVNIVRWRIHYYWALVLVLILLCLVIYGRTFAIICTSIWWYLVPNMKKGSKDLKSRTSMKKKDYIRSEKKMDLHGFSSFKIKNNNTKILRRLSSNKD